MKSIITIVLIGITFASCTNSNTQPTGKNQIVINTVDTVQLSLEQDLKSLNDSMIAEHSYNCKYATDGKTLEIHESKF